MNTASRRLMYPLLIIAVGVALLLLAADLLPEGVRDLMERGWAALPVVIGLDLLLANRLRWRGQRLPSSWMALLLTSALLLGVIAYAYQSQADELRDDYQEVLEPIPLGEHIQGVNVQVQVLSTALFVQHSPAFERVIGTRFAGSEASEVRIAAQEDENALVTLSVQERRPDWLPRLTEVGRGSLQVTVPVGVPLNNLDVANRAGAITLDLQAVQVSRLSVSSGSGDTELYMPLEGTLIGDIRLAEGNLLIVIRPEVRLRIENSPETVEVNPNNYRALVGGITESITVMGAEYDMILTLDMPNGTLTIVSPEELNR
ncbi:MAG: hypothetical protein HC915_08210 [Anaerolineae bacterium]|nr:hypothetical protein [Anaerolineae bacterium]